MSVVIRMKRTGRKNLPCYRISVANPRDPRDGRVIEHLGIYDPRASRPEARLQLEKERALHWLSRGARPSETVASILRREGLLKELPKKPKRDRSGRKRKTATKERRRARRAARAAAKAARPPHRRKPKQKEEKAA
jgi:small subunit ribosomal protein S16